MHTLALPSCQMKSVCQTAHCMLSFLKKTLDSHFLTQKACQFVGFLLFNGFIVQRLKVDIQNQNVITANRKGRIQVWKAGIQSSTFYTCFSRTVNKEDGWLQFLHRPKQMCRAERMTCHSKLIFPQRTWSSWCTEEMITVVWFQRKENQKGLA